MRLAHHHVQPRRLGGADGAAPDGSRVWDLSVAFPYDRDVPRVTVAPAAAWWGPSYANATYAERFSLGVGDFNVFFATDTQLLLEGWVGPTSGPPTTNLSYSPAAVMLTFPLAMGASWMTDSIFKGITIHETVDVPMCNLDSTAAALDPAFGPPVGPPYTCGP